MKKAIWLLLPALMLCFALGCGKQEPSAVQPETETQEQGGTSAQPAKPDQGGTQTPDPAPGQNDEKPGNTDQPVDDDPQFDGVYENETGTLVIRHAEEGACDIIVSLGEDGSDGYLAGVAQILDNMVIYETETYALCAVVSFDELTVTEDGKNPYSASGFAGVYHRTGADPLAVQVRGSSLAQALPDTFSQTTVNGENAILYIDPENRFTATVPDVFSSQGSSEEPGEILLESIDGDVFVSILFERLDGRETAEELKDRMEARTGAVADVFVDGSVALEYAENDFTVVILACPTEGGTVFVTYSYLSDQDDYFRPLVDQISINVN